MNENNTTTNAPAETKFCAECGAKIAKKAVVCPHCGCEVGERNAAPVVQPSIVINNSNQNQQTMNAGAVRGGKAKNKWVALLLCFFLGWCGAHKFYEEQIGTGILYLCTLGLFGIGSLINFIQLLFKDNPYYV